jgi:hypothetical protein
MYTRINKMNFKMKFIEEGYHTVALEDIQDDKTVVSVNVKALCAIKVLSQAESTVDEVESYINGCTAFAEG